MLSLADKVVKSKKVKFIGKSINFKERTNILLKKFETELIKLGKVTGIVDIDMLRSLNSESCLR
jgi:hypothetical protein